MILGVDVAVACRTFRLPTVMQIGPQLTPFDNTIKMTTLDQQSTNGFSLTYVLFMSIETFLAFKNTIAISARNQ